MIHPAPVQLFKQTNCNCYVVKYIIRKSNDQGYILELLATNLGTFGFSRQIILGQRGSAA